MVKIAFINQKVKGKLIETPITILSLASYLEKYGIEVSVIDEMAGRNIKKSLESLQPDIMVIWGTPIYTISVDKQKAYDLCLDNKNIVSVLGGPQFSSVADEAKNYCDYVVLGEGEKSLLKICKNFPKTKIIDCGYINNLDEIPLPARHLIDMDYYLKNEFKIYGVRARVERVLTSRGCPFSCIFCFNSKRKIPVRFNSLEHVIEELKFLKEKYDVEGVGFLDDNFLLDKKRAFEIFNKMIEEKLDLIWDCQVRSTNVDLKILRLMKRAGCIQVGFGFESGSQRILNYYRKGITVKQNENAVKMCKKAGLRVRGCFIIGSPIETLEDIRKTKDFIEKNNIDFVSLHRLSIMPGTVLWDMDNNYILPEKQINDVFEKLSAKYSLKNYRKIDLIRRVAQHPKVALKSFKSILDLGD